MLTVKGFTVHYGWPLVFVTTALVALVVRSFTEDKPMIAFTCWEKSCAKPEGRSENCRTSPLGAGVAPAAVETVFETWQVWLH